MNTVQSVKSNKNDWNGSKYSLIYRNLGKFMRMGSNTVKSMKIYVELWELNKKV